MVFPTLGWQLLECHLYLRDLFFPAAGARPRGLKECLGGCFLWTEGTKNSWCGSEVGATLARRAEKNFYWASIPIHARERDCVYTEVSTHVFMRVHACTHAWLRSLLKLVFEMTPPFLKRQRHSYFQMIELSLILGLPPKVERLVCD